MSAIHGKWNVEDIRKVMRGLDKKTGMNGASLPIVLCRTIGDGFTLGTYTPSKNENRHSFSFSLQYFNDPGFSDAAAIDVIRHEFCHYVVDVLE